MNKNDWYDAMMYGLRTNKELFFKEAVKEVVEYCNNDVKHTANIFEILKEERMNKVDKLTMCLRDIAKRYNLDFEAECELIKVFKLEKQDNSHIPAIKDVIFNDPATIVFWEDGTKTVVKAQDEEFDPEKGLAMAISKKALGNQGNYCNVFKKWLPEEGERIVEKKEYMISLHPELMYDVDQLTGMRIVKIDSSCIKPVKK